MKTHNHKNDRQIKTRKISNFHRLVFWTDFPGVWYVSTSLLVCLLVLYVQQRHLPGKNHTYKLFYESYVCSVNWVCPQKYSLTFYCFIARPQCTRKCFGVGSLSLSLSKKTTLWRCLLLRSRYSQYPWRIHKLEKPML